MIFLDPLQELTTELLTTINHNVVGVYFVMICNIQQSKLSEWIVILTKLTL